ncbi:MAG: hypothetical protein ACO3JL_15970 [Myxococcota bacterium]
MALFEDAKALLSSIELMVGLGAPEPLLPGLRAKVRGLIERVQRGGENDAAQTEYKALVGEFIKLDTKMPTTWFRQHVRFETTPASSLLAYGRVLGHHGESDDQLDRLELIVTRLISGQGEDGYRYPLGDDVAMPVLEAVAAGRMTTPERRQAAVSFFGEAAEKLDKLNNLDAIFETGLYLDVKGYKRVLGKDRCDPVVLYAAVLLNTAISNFLHRPGIQSERIDKLVQKENKKIDEVYEAKDLDPVSQRFEEVRRRMPAPRRQVTLVQRIRENRKTVAGLIVLLMGSSALVAVTPDQVLQASEAQGAAIFQRLGGVASGGTLYSRPGQRVAVGQVDASAWRAMDPAARQQEATRLLGEMSTHNLNSLQLFAEGSLVMHLSEQRLVFLQQRSAPAPTPTSQGPTR